MDTDDSVDKILRLQDQDIIELIKKSTIKSLKVTLEERNILLGWETRAV
jgi:hypothetical protein